MARKTKKILSFILSLSLILNFFLAVDVFPAKAALTSGSCGDNVTYSFDSSTGTLTISGTGPMRDYENVTDSPFHGVQDIKKIIIQSGVTTVGDYSFCCERVTSLTIPEGVTKIGKSAFYRLGIDVYGTAISVTLPNSLQRIEESAFNLTHITNITFGNSLTYIGDYAFSWCKELNNFVLPESLEYIGYAAFNAVYSITEISIPKNVSHIDHLAFSINSNGVIKNVNVDGENQYYCSDNGILFDKNKTTLIYCPCKNPITSYNVPDTVTTICASAFRCNENITSITIPDSVSVFGQKVFQNCSSLANIAITNNITNIGHLAFEGTAYYNDANNWSGDILYIGNYLVKAKDTLSGKYTINTGTKVIADNAFSGCTGLTDITIPDSVTSIGEKVFYSCTGLTGITIPSSVTNINDCTFYECTGLTNITIPDSVTSIGEKAFYGCTGLTDITLPNSVTNINANAFSGCTAMTEIRIINPECVINSSETTFPSEATIYACDVSTAKDYADTYNRNFVEKHENTYLVMQSSTAEKPLKYCNVCKCCGLKSTTKSVELGEFEHNGFDLYFKADKTSKILIHIDKSILMAPDDYLSLKSKVDNVNEGSVDAVAESGTSGYFVSFDSENKESSRRLGISVMNNQSVYTDSDGNCYFLVTLKDDDGKSYIGYVLFDDIAPDVAHTGLVKTVSNQGEANDISTYTCEDCGTSYTIKRDSEIHNYTASAVPDIEHDSEGAHVLSCSDCGLTFTDATSTHNYLPCVTEPTCTEQGYTTYTCSDCGDSYISDYTEIIPHNYITDIVEPTCTKQGYTTHTCSVCGDNYIDNYTNPLEHNYQSEVITSTCTEQGYTTYTCSRCHDTYISDYTETVPHTLGDVVRENEVAPSTSAQGSYDEVVYCTACHKELSRTTHTVDKLVTNLYIDYDNAVYAGSTIELPVVIDDNAGMLGFGLQFDYPADLIDVVKIVPNSEFSTALQDNIEGNAKPGSFKVFWAGNEQSTFNGTLFYIKMNVKDTAVGEGTINISCLDADTFDENFNDVKITCENYDFTVENTAISDFVKLESSAADIVAGGDVELKLKMTQFNNLQDAEINIAYNSNLKYLGCESDLVECSAKNKGENLKLSISGMSASMLNSDIVTIRFKSRDNADSGKYNFLLSSEDDNVKLTSCSFDVAASATSEIAEIAIPDGVIAESGETFTVPVNITNNKGVMGYRIKVKYNKDELSAVSVQPNEDIGGYTDNSIGKKEGEFDVIWNNSSDVVGDVTLFSITFNALSAESTVSDISIEYSQVDTFNEMFEDVVFDCQNGAVTICSNHEYTCEDVDATCTEGACKLYTCIHCGNTYKTDCTEALGHYYEYQGDYSSKELQYKCRDCNDEYVSTLDELNDIWSAEYINNEPNRTVTDYSSLIDLNNDGIINAKDYAAIRRMHKLAN